MILVLLSIAGGAGALARFVVDDLVRTKMGRSFPWGTLVVNVTGSLLVGVIAGLVVSGVISESYMLVLGVGFCGGYTTFSTTSFETVRLIERRNYTLATLNVVGTLLPALIGVAAGMSIV